MSGGRAVIRTESQRPCSIYHSLIILTPQHLLLKPKRRSVHSVVDVGEEAAFGIRRGNELHFAGLEGMIKQNMAHLVALKLGVEIPFAVCFKSLVEADLAPVVLADDTDFRRRNWLSTGQRPCPEPVTALAVDHAFHNHVGCLLHRLGCDIFIGCYGREGQWEEKER